MNIKRKILIAFAVLFGILVTVTSVNTITSKSMQIKEAPHYDKAVIDESIVSKHLSDAIKFRTVSYTEPDKFDYKEFTKLYKYIEENYPGIYRNLKKEVVNKYSLLYTWEGSDKSLKPVVLAAHTDVVGIEEETKGDWKYGPFSGEIAEGKIWGRGARDNKSQVMAILEAVEYLIKSNYAPKRTVYLAFGHDEEVLGLNGASKIAELLKSRGICPECVVDEGGAMQVNAAPGIKGKVAVISIAEKGNVTLQLSVKTKGGHSSEPEKETTIGILSAAVAKLEGAEFPSSLKPIESMFKFCAPEAKFPFNIVYSNTWLTGGVMKKILSSSTKTKGTIRTTAAVTVFNSGFQYNVIPASATALVNFRILPGETVDDVLKHAKEVMDDSRVQMEVKGYNNNPPVIAPVDNQCFKIIQTTIKQLFPDAVCMPFIVVGSTDLKHYASLTQNLYRFNPGLKEKDEVSHGINERIPVENYKQYIEFYLQLIKNFQEKI